MCLFFDDTTRLGEALVVVLFCFVDNNWKLQQRLTQVKIVAKSMTGEEIAQELIDTLSVNYSISSSRLIAAMRDRCSVNNVALRTLIIVYPNLVDIGCITQTISIAGERFQIPTLHEFTNLWNSLFVHSAKACLCWKEQCGFSAPTYSPTPWWSKFEVMKDVMVTFGDVQTFVSSHSDISQATQSMLLSILSDPVKQRLLLLELAAVIGAVECMGKVTYKLESGGPIVLETYELINSILESFKPQHVLNVNAISRQLAQIDSGAEQQLNSYVFLI